MVLCSDCNIELCVKASQSFCRIGNMHLHNSQFLCIMILSVCEFPVRRTTFIAKQLNRKPLNKCLLNVNLSFIIFALYYEFKKKKNSRIIYLFIESLSFFSLRQSKRKKILFRLIWGWRKNLQILYQEKCFLMHMNRQGTHCKNSCKCVCV